MTPHPTLTAECLRHCPLPTPKEGSKDERGSVLVVGGSRSVAGAAFLAGVAALRAGAGKLKIATVESVAAVMALAVPEAMVIGLAEDAEGGFDTGSASDQLAKLAGGCDALLVGPGMVEGDATTELSVGLLQVQRSASFVLDAASVCGLGARSNDVRACAGRTVITPHAGEMAQLLDMSRESVEADPLDAALRAADLLQAVVVMKGARTWIVEPRGARWLYEGGGVGLATSGSGDALAGLIVGLLARGVAPMPAALWGVFLHGEAGKRLAASVGPIGFLAREIAGEVPNLLREAKA
ncbi:NAD(P)H-hydrate dehydratase [Methylobacterium sp. A54F]